MQLIVLAVFLTLLSDSNPHSVQKNCWKEIPAAKTSWNDVPSKAAVRNAPKIASVTPRFTQLHVARKGDTVSKLARTILGADTKANRQAIIDLNPSLQHNPNLMVVGKTYVLPVPQL